MLKRLFVKIKDLNQKGITGLETAIILIAFVVVAAVFAYTVLSAGLFATQKSSEAVYAGLEETQSTLELRGGVTAYASTAGASGAANTDVFCTSAGAASTTISEAVTRVQFTLANVVGGEPINLNASGTMNNTESSGIDCPTYDVTRMTGSADKHTMVITYDDQFNSFSDCTWTKEWIGKNDSDELLETGEKAMITVHLIPWKETGTEAFEMLSGDGGTDAYFSDTDESSGYLIDTDHEFRLQVKPTEGASLMIERTTPANLDNVMDLH